MVNRGGKKQEGIWQRRTTRAQEGRAEEVRQMEESKESRSSEKVEDSLQENRQWHFSLHMYQRPKGEFSLREQILSAETDVGSVRRHQKTTETKINMKPQQEQRLETEEEEQADSPRKEQENKEECAERKINRGEDEEERAKLKRLSEEDRWDTGSDSGGEMEENTEAKTGTMAPCHPHGGQSFTFSSISRPKVTMLTFTVISPAGSSAQLKLTQ